MELSVRQDRAAGGHVDDAPVAMAWAADRVAKVGMTREGHLRQNMLAHAAWRDSVLYAILESE